MVFIFSPLFLAALVYLPIAWWFVARAMLRWMGPVGWGIRHHGAVCGNCGHPAIQRDSEMCPECGVRYSIAGVATPVAMFNAAPTLLSVGIALLPIIVLGGVLSAQAIGGAIMFIRHGVVSVRQISTELSTQPLAADAEPGSSRLSSLSVDFEVEALATVQNQRPLQGALTVSLSGTGVSVYQLEYEIHTDRWIIRDQAGVEVSRGNEIDRGVEALFMRAGLDTEIEHTSRTLTTPRNSHAKLHLQAIGHPGRPPYSCFRTSSRGNSISRAIEAAPHWLCSQAAPSRGYREVS